ncbi:hypothetical protein HK103_006256 [Boothiomyces macroporosus]|uniref:Uncharacterized protein n=1 Tax=Boothiomyces macroporosus TaxID=261099 RepID=A0AAD5UEJ9_9FUNG|nr:hypothetical protein HK103_006256 [Boothiomyces macroporosus]
MPTIPICILGIDKTRIGYEQFKEQGGFQVDVLKEVVRIKEIGDNLIREDGYNQHPDAFLKAFVGQCAQPGMVIVDMMPKSHESQTLSALRAASSLGASVLLLFPRPAEFKQECIKLFGEERVSISTKLPTVKKLIYMIIDSYNANPAKERPIPENLVVGLRKGHVHGPNCRHDFEHSVTPKPASQQHHHGPNCNHSHPEPVQQHIHGSNCNHSQPEPKHVHGPNCSHDNPVSFTKSNHSNLHDSGHGGHSHDHSHGGHSHDHPHGDEHVHGENCNHRDPQEELLVQQNMKLIVQDFPTAHKELKNGNIGVVLAIIELIMMGKPPETLKFPHNDFADGFGVFFVRKNIMGDLISLANEAIHGESTDVYPIMDAIVDLLYIAYIDDRVLDQFEATGGIELLRGSTQFPGSDIIKSNDPYLSEIGEALITQLKQFSRYKRLCNYCKKREDKQAAFKLCVRCKECQVEDWKTHKTVCKA